MKPYSQLIRPCLLVKFKNMDALREAREKAVLKIKSLQMALENVHPELSESNGERQCVLEKSAA